MATLNNFKRLAANGHLNKLMAEGVADAIAKSRALGLPVEGYLNGDPVPAEAAGASAKTTASIASGESDRGAGKGANR